MNKLNNVWERRGIDCNHELTFLISKFSRFQQAKRGKKITDS